jgi:hypothetical protein
MTKLYNDNGLLSDYGKDVFSSLDREINLLLYLAEDQNELRIIGSLIKKRVGDLISMHIERTNQNNY